MYTTKLSTLFSLLYDTIFIPILLAGAIIVGAIFLRKMIYELKRFIIGGPAPKKETPPDYRVSTDMCHCSNCKFCNHSSFETAYCSKFDITISFEYICDDYLIEGAVN